MVRRAADGALEQVGDVLLKDSVCLEADGVLVTFGFEELVEVGQRKRGIAPEKTPLRLVPVADHDRLQDRAPAIGAVDIAGPEHAPLQITELVEHEEWMVAGATEVAVEGSALLFAMGRAERTVHAGHDQLRRVVAMNPLDPDAREVSERGKVVAGGKKLRLEAPHPAGGSGLLCNSAAAGNPAHRRVTSRSVSVVCVLIATEAAEGGLAKQSCQRMPAVLAGARVNEIVANHVGQPERVIEFTIGEQSGVGGDPGAMKPELQAAVEIKPQRPVLRFTRRVRHLFRLKVPSTH